MAVRRVKWSLLRGYIGLYDPTNGNEMETGIIIG